MDSCIYEGRVKHTRPGRRSRDFGAAITLVRTINPLGMLFGI
jgi:hypothetical protein